METKGVGVPRPVLDLVGPCDAIDVHADLVADVGGQRGGRGVGGGLEDHSCPELLLLQQVQGPGHQLVLGGHCLDLVQADTLQAGQAGLSRARGGPACPGSWGNTHLHEL